MVSRTCTRNDDVEVLLFAYCAVQRTVVFPIWKSEPELGKHMRDTILDTLSVAVALNLTYVPSLVVALTTIDRGTFIITSEASQPRQKFVLWPGPASSTGKLRDLRSCYVQEIVRYESRPLIFTVDVRDPTVVTLPATQTPNIDFHFLAGGLTNGINHLLLIPGFETTQISNQVYQYRCPPSGPDCSEDWTDIPGQTYRIIRHISQRNDRWIYTITKESTSPGYNFFYSRPSLIPL